MLTFYSTRLARQKFYLEKKLSSESSKIQKWHSLDSLEFSLLCFERVPSTRRVFLKERCNFYAIWNIDYDNFGVPIVQDDIIELANTLAQRLFPDDVSIPEDVLEPQKEIFDTAFFESSKVPVVEQDEHKLDLVKNDFTVGDNKFIDMCGGWRLNYFVLLILSKSHTPLLLFSYEIKSAQFSYRK